MADISFNIACNKLKIAQVVWANQLFQLLNLVRIYGHGLGVDHLIFDGGGGGGGKSPKKFRAYFFG